MHIHAFACLHILHGIKHVACVAKDVQRCLLTVFFLLQYQVFTAEQHLWADEPLSVSDSTPVSRPGAAKCPGLLAPDRPSYTVSVNLSFAQASPRSTYRNITSSLMVCTRQASLI